MFCRFSLWPGWTSRSCAGPIHLLSNSRSTFCIGRVTKLTFRMLLLYYFGKNKQKRTAVFFVVVVFVEIALPITIVTSFDEYGQHPRVQISVRDL